MAKFDHAVNLPAIFREHHLSILPVSRSEYLIGPFDTHQSVSYEGGAEVQSVELPVELESIDYTNLYSEAAALNCAYISGLIDKLVGEETHHTVSGRMSTDSFNFTIRSTDPAVSPSAVAVDSSQCEIDGGYEGAGHFVLIEAKNFKVDDFLVRQLYYPYRLWSSKLSKRVVPVLMTYSNDIFDFFVFEVADESEYNSLRLVAHKRYSIGPEDITREDISLLLSKLRSVEDEVTFPQANDFERVVDLLSILNEHGMRSRDQITSNYSFDERQTNYYTDACRYLELVDKSKDEITGEVTFVLSQRARSLWRQRHKVRYVGLIETILEHEAFRQSFEYSMEHGSLPSVETISALVMSRTDLNVTTARRRAGTVRGWLNWILEQVAD